MTWRCCGTAGMARLFDGVRAPSTLGTFLRAFTFGHVLQLDAVASRLLIGLAGQAPLLPGAGELTYIDVDDTVRQTYGYAKQGAGRGYTGTKGFNALLAIVSTPSSAPVNKQPDWSFDPVDSGKNPVDRLAEGGAPA